jgi:hypothetical protein
VVGQLGMWWLSWVCGDAARDAVAQSVMCWDSWGCGDVVGDVVT